MACSCIYLYILWNCVCARDLYIVGQTDIQVEKEDSERAKEVKRGREVLLGVVLCLHKKTLAQGNTVADYNMYIQCTAFILHTRTSA